jgi:hypothetical protein
MHKTQNRVMNIISAWAVANHFFRDFPPKVISIKIPYGGVYINCALDRES